MEAFYQIGQRFGISVHADKLCDHRHIASAVR